MSSTDDARAVAPVTWDEIGNGSRNAGTPRSRPFSADQSTAADAFGCRFKWLPPRKVRPHPILQRYGIAATTAERNKNLQQDQATLQEPIHVTTDGVILDGFPQWKAALDAGRELVLCVERSLNEEQQIEWILQKNRRRNGWNAFCRIMTALELEPILRAQARNNQVIGGEKKLLSNLTKAQQKHVRTKQSKLADTCPAYIDYSKRIRDDADDSVIRALERGEVPIYWAWKLLKFSKPEQKEMLEGRRIQKSVQQALPRHRRKPVSIDPKKTRRLLRALEALKPDEMKCSVASIDEKVEIRVAIEKQLFTSLQAQGELNLG